ncbi:hypothetical protein [Desulforhopalus sp. 52FAK]
MNNTSLSITLCALILFVGCSSISYAADNVKDLAKQSQNPVSTLISVPFEMNNTLNNGPEDAYAMTLNIKPVIPMSFGENWNLINRVIAPVVYQDEFYQDEGSVFGLGDITYQSFFSPKKQGNLSGVWDRC